MILIIGSGPTGLGAAWRLHELGHKDWRLISPGDPGGLASSIMDDAGYTWDLGVHALFSHYKYFDGVMDALGLEWIEHTRSAWAYMRDRFIPYPVQNNIWRLPEDEQLACLKGVITTATDLWPEITRDEIETFQDWILSYFGRGLADTFLLPYNRKIWACEPSTMDACWMGERVPTVNLWKIIKSVVCRTDIEQDWGPNARFRYPAQGGTGAIWQALASKLPAENFIKGKVTSVLGDTHFVRVNGELLHYDHLISTLPIPRLVEMVGDLRDHSDPWVKKCEAFKHTTTHVVGVGIPRDRDPIHPGFGRSLNPKHWVYFPEPEYPFYRVTVLTNFAPNMAPEWHCSLLCEVSEPSDKATNPRTDIDTVQATVAGLRRAGFIPESGTFHIFHERMPYGYPVPFLGYRKLRNEVNEYLEGFNILSRGRFGGWDYACGNQDHSMMQGVEAVDRILNDGDEPTFNRPDYVNGGALKA